ncbi:MAG: hypothetical protein RBS40_13395 [Rhodocyclaceae bacterium]|jgi:hypothetical protein|nr:hypothetical protein [Rhodocyclaceae bacterium]
MIDLLANETIEAIKQAGATPAELRKAGLLTNDVKRAMVALNDESSLSNRRNLADAESAQAEFVGELVDRYIGGGSDRARSADRFRTRKAALDWLRDQGATISQGKFYQDCEAGRVMVAPDKTVSKFEVSEYLRSLQRQVTPDLQLLDRQSRKEALEIRRLELEVAKREMEHRAAEAEWLRAETAWAAVAALLGQVLDNLRHHFHQAAPELVHLAGGEPERAPELYEQCEQVIGRAMADIQPTVQGIFAEEEVDDEQ